MVGSYSHLDEIFPSRLIRKASARSRLVSVAEPTIALDDYLARNPTTGLLVAQGDTIFIERCSGGSVASRARDR